MPCQNARGDWNGEGQKPHESRARPRGANSTEMQGYQSKIPGCRFSDQPTRGTDDSP